MAAGDEIDAFWAWFSETSDLIAADPTDEALVEELDRRVSRLGCPAWEIGPGSEEDWFLALSPAGDSEALPLTQEIVSQAPRIPGWELLPHRPRKSWLLQFEIEGESGPIEIDARSWQFVAYRYPDGVYDLVVSVGRETDLGTEDRDLAVRMAVEGQLGEEALLTRINEIEAVVELSADQAGKARPLTSLGTDQPQ